MHYDAIVIGLGVIGSSACWQLARRGKRVLGLDARSIGHTDGSSHGQTRIIRRAYFEDPAYLPLLDDAYRGWEELEQLTGTRLIHRTGLLLAGPADGAVIAGVHQTMAKHALDIATLTAADATGRYPGFRLPADWTALLERDAGYLPVETCVALLVEQARLAGAELQDNNAVIAWQDRGSDITVRTQRGVWTADTLVCCAGGWTGQLVPELAALLEIRRKPVFWFPRHDETCSVTGGCPVFGFDTPHGFFYGFPGIDDRGVKVGNHTGGEVARNPADVDRAHRLDDETSIRGLVQAYLPGVDATAVGAHNVCLYTMTPDEHFWVDRHPGHARVWVAAGFSGHGFKFGPTIGRILADQVIDGANHVAGQSVRLADQLTARALRSKTGRVIS